MHTHTVKILAGIVNYFTWNCGVTPQAYRECAEENCGFGDHAENYYFPKGRGPNGQPLTDERIRYDTETK